MGTLLEAMDQAKLDNQREVVKNERRQSIDNQPYGTWPEKMEEALFPEGHPYHHDVIGSMADLSAASLTDVENFFKTYYAPNNAVLVVAGDIDVPLAKQLVRKYFGPIPRGPKVPPLANMRLPEVVGHQQRYVIVDSQIPAPAIYVGYRVPSAKDSRAPVVSLLGDVIGSGRSSRLSHSRIEASYTRTSRNPASRSAKAVCDARQPTSGRDVLIALVEHAIATIRRNAELSAGVLAP